MWKENGVLFCKTIECKERDIWESKIGDSLPKSSVQM